MGVLLCLLSAACFGTLAIFGKLAFEADVSVMTVLCVRFLIAAVVFGLLLASRRGDRRRLDRRLVLTGLGLGAVGYAGQAGLFFAALERMDASLLALILYAYPALVTVAAVLLGRERITARRTLALLAASLGVGLVLAGAGTGSFDALGAAFGFGAALAYTIYILVAEGVVGRVPPVLLCTVVMTGAAVSFTLLSLALGALDLGFAPIGWLWLACMALVSTVGAMLAFFGGLRRVGASTASILSTFEPPVTLALAALAFGEVLTAVQLAGAVLVLSAVAILNARMRARETATHPPTLPI